MQTQTSVYTIQSTFLTSGYLCSATKFSLQLCGRGRRGGTPSRAHLLYPCKVKLKDPYLQKYCSRNPECRRSIVLHGSWNPECCRSIVLHGLGSDVEAVDNFRDPAKCCDVCSACCPYSKLDILKPLRRQRENGQPM